MKINIKLKKKLNVKSNCLRGVECGYWKGWGRELIFFYHKHSVTI